MIARAESEFVLHDRATPAMRSMRTEAVKARGEFRKTGDELDRLARRSDTATRRIARNMGTIEHRTLRMTARVSEGLGRLDRQLDRLGRITAAPKVVVVGAAAARAEVNALRQDLAALDRAQAGPRARAVTGGSALAGASAGAVAARGGGGRGGMSFGSAAGVLRSPWGLAAALPVGRAAIGGGGALLGSAGSAALGAGAIGIAGGGAATAGLAGFVSLLAPAKSKVEEASKAQTKYNESVRQFGRYSREAAIAKTEFDRVLSKAPEGTTALLRETKALREEWDKITRSGQSDLLLTGSSFLRDVRTRAAPTLGGNANMVGRATRTQGGNFSDFLTSGRTLRASREFTELFVDTLDEAERTAENTLGTIINIGRAAKPFFKEGASWVERWTEGWDRSTSDIDHTRAKIATMVEDLRAWKNLGGAAFRLTRDVLSGGRAEGSSAIVQLTGTLDRWDQWVNDNPEKVRRFFADTTDSAKRLAGAMVEGVRALDKFAQLLQPMLSRLSDAATLAGQIGLLQPGALGIAYGAYRGAKGAGRGGAPAGGGGGGGVPLVVPTGGGGGMGAPTAVGRGGRAGALGMGALRGAGRAAWPIALGLGVLDFATGEGTVPQRFGGAVDSALLGIPAALGLNLRGTLPKSGNQRADEFIDRTGGDPRSVTRQVGHLRRVLDRDAEIAQQRESLQDRYASLSPTGAAGERNRVRRQREALPDPIDRKRVEQELKALMPAYRAGQTSLGQSAAGDVQEAFGITQDRRGTRSARRQFGRDFRGEFRQGTKEARDALSKGVASWVSVLEQGDKSQRRTARRMVQSIVEEYARLGRRVRVVNGEILMGTRKEWSGISQAMTSRAEQARQRTQKAFTAIQQSAVGSLSAMGYSKNQARSIVRDLEGGSVSARRDAVQGPTGAGQRPSTNDKNMVAGHGGGIGDAWGADAHRTGRNPSGTRTRNDSGAQGGIMGANAGLGVYARDASRYGLSVTSGLRPGAVTNSGNTSYHASGDALDVAGPPEAMMRFAQHAARAYGSRLEELIHTPLGFSIKNGQRVGAYAQADHYDHVHLADTAPGGLRGGGPGGGAGRGAGGIVEKINIKRPRAKTPGLAGMLEQAATDLYAGALERKVNDKIGGGSVGGGKGGVLSFNQVARIAEAAGLPGITFAQIAKGESGLNPRAVGNDPGGTQGLGLWQITTGFNDDIIKRFGGRDAMFNPRINARAAKAIYERQGIGAWYGTQYMTAPNAHYEGDGWGAPKFGGWFGKGGKGTARRPTIIGVGDRPGGEDFKVTPRKLGPRKRGGGGARGGVSVIIENMQIDYRGRGDVRKVVRRELREAIEELTAELDMSEEDAEDALA